MAKISKIGWCDGTWSSWWGCTKVDPTCTHCYAATLSAIYGKSLWGLKAPREKKLNWEKKWKELDQDFFECVSCGYRGDDFTHFMTIHRCPVCANPGEQVRRRVFVMSMGDFFDEHPDVVEWRNEAFTYLEKTKCSVLLLTQRVGNVASMVPSSWMNGWPEHVWLGRSAGTQKTYDKDREAFASIPAPIKFLSLEPMLEPIDLRFDVSKVGGRKLGMMIGDIDWVIVGGESGPKHRHFEFDWVRSVFEQAKYCNVARFMKQAGGHPDKRENLLDFPEDLRIREFPDE